MFLQDPVNLLEAACPSAVRCSTATAAWLPLSPLAPPSVPCGAKLCTGHLSRSLGFSCLRMQASLFLYSLLHFNPSPCNRGPQIWSQKANEATSQTTAVCVCVYVGTINLYCLNNWPSAFPPVSEAVKQSTIANILQHLCWAGVCSACLSLFHPLTPLQR